jgi:hypothetical protein
VSAFLGAIGLTFGLGFFYFVGAVPGGVAAGLSVLIATIVSWIGYAAGAGVMLLLGEPAREWIARKLRLPRERDPSKLFWRTWDRFGLPGMGLLAPVTIGPQASCLLALALGEKPARIFVALVLGVLPWCIGFAVVVELGLMAVGVE